MELADLLEAEAATKDRFKKLNAKYARYTKLKRDCEIEARKINEDFDQTLDATRAAIRAGITSFGSAAYNYALASVSAHGVSDFNWLKKIVAGLEALDAELRAHKGEPFLLKGNDDPRYDRYYCFGVIRGGLRFSIDPKPTTWLKIRDACQLETGNRCVTFVRSNILFSDREIKHPARRYTDPWIHRGTGVKIPDRILRWFSLSNFDTPLITDELTMTAQDLDQEIEVLVANLRTRWLNNEANHLVIGDAVWENFRPTDKAVLAEALGVRKNELPS